MVNLQTCAPNNLFACVDWGMNDLVKQYQTGSEDPIGGSRNFCRNTFKQTITFCKEKSKMTDTKSEDGLKDGYQFIFVCIYASFSLV